jgi:heme exporter protein D
MDLGPHAVFIWLCYAAAAIVIGGLVAWLIIDGRRQAKALAEFEARGIRRRSADADAASASGTSSTPLESSC